MVFWGFVLVIAGGGIGGIGIHILISPSPELEARGDTWTAWLVLGMGFLFALFGAITAIDQIRRNRKAKEQISGAEDYNPYRLIDLAFRLARFGKRGSGAYWKKWRTAEYGTSEFQVEIEVPIFSRFERLMWRLWAMNLVEEPGLNVWVRIKQSPIAAEDGSSNVISDHFHISNRDRKGVFHTSHVTRYRADGSLDLDDALTKREEKKEEDKAWSQLKYSGGLYDATPEQIEMVEGLLYSLASGEFTESYHSGIGKFCAICGSETDGEHDRELHARPTIRFCHVCGANWSAGKSCDAGLHG